MVDQSSVRTEVDPDDLAPVLNTHLRFEPPVDELEPGDKCQGFARIPFCVSKREVDVNTELMREKGLEHVRSELATGARWDKPQLRRLRLEFGWVISKTVRPETISKDAQNVAEDLLVSEVKQILETNTFEQPIYGFKTSTRYQSGSSDSLSSQIERVEVGTATWTVDGVYVKPCDGPAPSVDEPSYEVDDDYGD